MVVEVIVDPSFALGERRVLFPLDDYLFGNGHAGYDISADDQRFVMLRAVGEAEDTELILVVNWFTELRQRMSGN